jgi:type I restriction-modification system DNA methylase subunit
MGKIKNKDYAVESSMSDYMKEALAGSAKTKRKTSFGKPDFHLESLSTPIIIEDKLHSNRLIAQSKDRIKDDDASIANYAVNGALYYAQNMIASGKYQEVIAIGVAGDDEQSVKIGIYYVYGTGAAAYKHMHQYSSLDFLENDISFAQFYKDATLSSEEKHKILIDSRSKLQKYAKELNKLMHNHSITAPQRVLYVSGMLLSMQDLIRNGAIEKPGLTPDELRGSMLEGEQDGDKIVSHIKHFLALKELPPEKVKLMLSSFAEINKDSDRNVPIDLEKEVSKFIDGKASTNKQIFNFIYEYIYKSIEGMAGHLDIMGEMYSEFLKYALGDGKEIGIVLTPPYITKLMTEILDINVDSRVMDIATGSAGFLISAMETMINEAEFKYGRGTTQANKKIQNIKTNQLLGVELNAEMFTLASTNMILRGDGSSNIQKGSSFDRPESLYSDFGADRLLLNPPFSFKENGMPFLEFGLRHMQIGGRAAIIIQDSAGSGKAVKTNQAILRENQLLASIKMPVDLFVPMAGVQTSIYIVQHTGKPHDHEKQVRFIDFRIDGHKRSKRSLADIDSPSQRYEDVVQIYKNGKDAKVHEGLWEIDKTVVMDEIDQSGADWNFDQHQILDIRPTEDDMKKVVADYLAWEVSQALKSE